MSTKKSDKDSIENFIYADSRFDNVSPVKIKKVVNILFDEWIGSIDNYNNVDEYLTDLDMNGGLEGYLDESKTIKLTGQQRKLVKEYAKKLVGKRLNEELNKTIGRKSSNPDWVRGNDLLNDLIEDIPFPVKAFCDVSYLDNFIYVNPKNRLKLDDCMKNKGFIVNKGTEFWGNQHSTPYHHYSKGSPKSAQKHGDYIIIKTKNKRDVPENF